MTINTMIKILQNLSQSGEGDKLLYLQVPIDGLMPVTELFITSEGKWKISADPEAVYSDEDQDDNPR